MKRAFFSACVVIGSRARLRIWCRKAWGFESLHAHKVNLMATVYILFSKSLNKYYIGSCNEINTRLEEHINKKFSDSFTGKAHDWELFQQIENLEYNQARKIEVHIKGIKSRNYINNLNKY